MSSIKRRHTPSPSRTSSPSGTPKALRVSAPVRSPLLCTLPPTCHLPNRSTPLSDSSALEAHYATHHAHVCSSPSCGCIFPDARLLELHIAECHNPLAEVLRERGEKTFACHLPSCPRKFSTPKTRRLHLIDVHAYPKEYFFAVTNKGIGGLLRRWGDGASLLRGPWCPRDTEINAEGEGDEDVSPLRRQSLLHQHSDPEGEKERENPFLPVPDSTHTSVSADQKVTTDTMDDNGMVRGGDADEEVDALANSVSALSLVPSSIRFGRGGPGPRGRAGFATHSGRPVARSSGHPPVESQSHGAVSDKDREKGVYAEAGSNVTEQDAVVVSDKTPPARGRRGRGRVSGDGRGSGGRGTGRARGFVPPPPRGGFLSRGAAGRGFPRGLITVRGRGV